MNLKKIYYKLNYQILRRHYYGITATSRVLPKFLIIGGVRCGTTSLYYDICKHPSVEKAAYDEIGFFDDNYHLGIDWYRSMFPTEKKMNKIQKETGFCVTGEDTPFYIWNKSVIEKIKNLITEIKLIVILRNPVDRAYSNYHLSVREGNENRSFKDAIRNDIKFINYKKHNNEELTNIDFKKSYIAKGLYYDQLLNWFNTFDKKQICIVFTEDLRDNPEDTMRTIFKFLQLPFFSIKKYEKQKMSDYNDMEKEIRMELSRYYESYNEQLFELIKCRCW
jgi:hypothetical protein